MRKIPTVFCRVLEDMNRLSRDVHPDCWWVINGEGVALHKADGTCLLLDSGFTWWARRQVRPGKNPPPGYVPVEHDEVTGKTFGWEPVEQSPYAPLLREALAADEVKDITRWHPGTYELVGPKINNNPEGIIGSHRLYKHSGLPERPGAPRTYEGLRDWLATYPGEGVVFHHEDGRMAKIKRRDVMDA